MSGKKKVLFFCRENASRSQMAEGFMRALAPDSFEAYSAGTEPSVVNPYAVRVMSEEGVDISNQRSKHYSEVKSINFDFIITLCGKEACPFIDISADQVIDWEVEDPAFFSGNEEETLVHFRKVRDKIKKKLVEFIKTTPGN